MNEELAKKIEELDTRRAQILCTLCEDDRVFYPEVILGLVHEIRGITRILKILKGNR